MKWAVAQLIKQGSQEFEIHDTIDFSKLLRPSDEIRSISPVTVDGKGQLQGKKVVFTLHIEGTMTLGCALTLDDVLYPFQMDTVEVFVLEGGDFDEASDEIPVTSTVVELAPVIWQNIFLQKPLRVVKEGAYEELKQQGIELETEEDLVQEQASEAPVDPRLAVLSKLLGDQHEER